MIKTIECFTVICDNCGEDLYEGHEHCGYSDKDYVQESATLTDWQEIDGKDICDKCWCYNDEDELVIIESRKKP